MHCDQKTGLSNQNVFSAHGMKIGHAKAGAVVQMEC